MNKTKDYHAVSLSGGKDSTAMPVSYTHLRAHETVA